MGKNLLFHKLALKAMGNAAKIIFQGLRDSLIKKKNPDYKEARRQFTEGLRTFVERMQDQKYHGGTQPDDADFTVYGMIKSKTGSESFTSFLKREAPPKFNEWLRLMDIKCKYQDRNYEG